MFVVSDRGLGKDEDVYIGVRNRVENFISGEEGYKFRREYMECNEEGLCR
jgi:hypothetical protein